MENKIRYTLGKKERLKSRKAIEQVFKEGKSFMLFPFRILYLLNKGQLSVVNSNSPEKAPGLQAGFSVSTRNFKKAVDRNRVKRLMREAYRHQKNELQLLPVITNHTLSVFFIYVGKGLPDHKLVNEKMTLAIKRLIKSTSENR